MTREPASAPASAAASPRYIRARISKACDTCKAHKIRCDGAAPCLQCVRRRRDAGCRYSERVARASRAKGVRSVTDSPGVSGQASPGPRNSRGGRQGDSELDEHRDDGGSGSGRGEKARKRRRVGSDADERGEGLRGDAQEERDEERPRDTLHADREIHRTRHGHTNGQPWASHEDETEVPREARLLRDAQGTLIFIGDCAPLAFFQSVRRIVNSLPVGRSHAEHTVDTSHHGSFHGPHENYHRNENHRSDHHDNQSFARRHPHQTAPDAPRPDQGRRELTYDLVRPAVRGYFAATAGMVDLGIPNLSALLHNHIVSLPSHTFSPSSPPFPLPSATPQSIILTLILAIGLLDAPAYEPTARHLFALAQPHAWRFLAETDLGIDTVRVFLLITVYMLAGRQLNSAFLYFGVAVRGAYSVGLHRREVNQRVEGHGGWGEGSRDRLWKSLRIVDLYLSTSLGRPPGMSDVDCTVGYGVYPRGPACGDESGQRGAEAGMGQEHAASGDKVGQAEQKVDLLTASVQILLILETIVLRIFSRRRISLQLIEGITGELRDWSGKWLGKLKGEMAGGIRRQRERTRERQSQSGQQQTRQRSRGQGHEVEGNQSWDEQGEQDAGDTEEKEAEEEARVPGACQILATYYYAVMLVSRPFFMYELCRALAGRDGYGPTSTEPTHGGAGNGGHGGLRPGQTHGVAGRSRGGAAGARRDAAGVPRADTAGVSGRRKLADACMDAAGMMVDMVLELVAEGSLRGRMPLLVSWLFASSLVLAAAPLHTTAPFLGNNASVFGNINTSTSSSSLQRAAALDSVHALDFFARHDPHAQQYAHIARGLMGSVLGYVEVLERAERRQRREGSSLLFGLLGNGGSSSSGMAEAEADAEEEEEGGEERGRAGGGERGGRLLRMSWSPELLRRQEPLLVQEDGLGTGMASSVLPGTTNSGAPVSTAATSTMSGTAAETTTLPTTSGAPSTGSGPEMTGDRGADGGGGGGGGIGDHTQGSNDMLSLLPDLADFDPAFLGLPDFSWSLPHPPAYSSSSSSYSHTHSLSHPHPPPHPLHTAHSPLLPFPSHHSSLNNSSSSNNSNNNNNNNNNYPSPNTPAQNQLSTTSQQQEKEPPATTGAGPHGGPSIPLPAASNHHAVGPHWHANHGHVPGFGSGGGQEMSGGHAAAAAGDAVSALNLFPLLQSGGGIDLADYF